METKQQQLSETLTYINQVKNLTQKYKGHTIILSELMKPENIHLLYVKDNGEPVFLDKNNGHIYKITETLLFSKQLLNKVKGTMHIYPELLEHTKKNSMNS